MERYIYIKRSQYNKYLEFDTPLLSIEYNNLSTTNSWEDYLANKWILLSSEQIAFHEEHPDASVREVWSMQLKPESELTLDLAKAKKLEELELFDKSDKVNGFNINGQTMWLTVEERLQIASQITAHEAIGRTEMTRWFNGVSFTFLLENWKQMLTALEVYAGDALNVTERHRAAINALDKIEDVKSYNFEIGYPLKLLF